MTNDEQHLQLAGEFPPVTYEEWRALVNGVLAKGLSDPTPEELAARFERTLVSHTYDGIAIQPLYDGRVGEREPGLPGQAPFVRGRTPLGNAAGGWDVCQRVEVEGDGSAANALALEELENGATSLWLGLAGAESPEALRRVLDGVHLDLIGVRLDGGERAGEMARAFAALGGSGPANLGLDPIGQAASTGSHGDVADGLAEAAEVAQGCRAGVRALVVDAVRYHRAGAADAEELGCALATAVAYLRELTGAGMTLPAAWAQMEVRLAASADQFSTIAKFRAARRLWGRVAEVMELDPAVTVPPLHAVTSPAMLSAYDPWVNLLRTTVACFGAGVGGADAVTVAPYDAVATGPGSSDLGRRLARNIQSLLLEESGMARIIDPAGGSWYVEALTDELAAAAWRWFQDIETAGGMAAALGAGMVGERLASTWTKRSARLATGADPLTGVSEFPNIDESPPPKLPVPVGGAAGGLPVHRYPEAFEALRARTDAQVAAGGSRPRVFLATIGTPAQFTARATFAKNLFEVVGIRALEGDATTFGATEATLACICSTDKIYSEQAAGVARALKDAGATRVYLAGRPGDRRGEWEAAGIDEFIYQGCDRLDVLARVLDVAGVA
jgi:methylmalonyl-CoA mutase